MTTTTSPKTQTRGICQCCGRDQAVLGSGLMSKHGYTVEHCWFAGVCRGQNFQPLQISRVELDGVCREVSADCDALVVRLAALRDGTVHPATCTGSWDFAARKYATIAWADAQECQRRDALHTACIRTEQRISMGRQFVTQLQALAEQHHGQPLRIVRAAEAPAPIESGEQRMKAGKVFTATTIGRSVRATFQRDGQRFSTLISTRSWRAMPLLATAAQAAA